MIIQSPVGALGIEHDDDALRGIVFLGQLQIPIQTLSRFEQNIKRQFDAYFTEQHFKLTLPYQLNVTPFQQRVLTALKRIPYGETRTYGQVAKQLNTSARAIGGACRRNPLPLIFPCHRVVGQSSLGGFSGETSGWRTDIKTMLLSREKPSL